MAFRQSTGSKFDISIDHITQALVDGEGAQSRADALQLTEEAPNDEKLEGEGFGAQYARARSALSEFSSAEPTNAAGASEKLRRDINSVLNIGGGGGALYTADRNPFSDGDDDDPTSDALEKMVETTQQSLKREQEERYNQRFKWAEEDWDKSEHTLGGIKMSGQAWDELYEALDTPEEVEASAQDISVRRKCSPAEARKIAQRVADMARLQQDVKNGKISQAEADAKIEEWRQQNPSLQNAADEEAQRLAAAKAKIEQGLSNTKDKSELFSKTSFSRSLEDNESALTSKRDFNAAAPGMIQQKAPEHLASVTLETTRKTAPTESLGFG